MICDQLTSLLGFDCDPLAEDGSVAAVTTPFRFDDGDAVPVYVEIAGEQVRFFDDGHTLAHFLGRGIRLENRRKTQVIASAAADHGARFSHAGEVEVWATRARAHEGFASYIGAMLSLCEWEKDQRGASTDVTLLIDEVAMALCSWKPLAQMDRDPEVLGISGRPYRMDFRFDGELVAVASPHRRSAQAVLHKLVDIKGRAANQGTNLVVVIDDRTDPDAARSEGLVLQAVARVIPLSTLEARGVRGAHRIGSAVQ